MNEGGVYLNCGSAVTLPEVFSEVRYACAQLREAACQNFTTANWILFSIIGLLKMSFGGRSAMAESIAITGHHEITIPLLAAWLIELAELNSKKMPCMP